MILHTRVIKNYSHEYELVIFFFIFFFFFLAANLFDNFQFPALIKKLFPYLSIFDRFYFTCTKFKWLIETKGWAFSPRQSLHSASVKIEIFINISSPSLLAGRSNVSRVAYKKGEKIIIILFQANQVGCYVCMWQFRSYLKRRKLNHVELIHAKKKLHKIKHDFCHPKLREALQRFQNSLWTGLSHSDLTIQLMVLR